jgi:hypothetical protein
MVASNSTPRSGESVSDAQHVENVLVDEVDECRYLLRKTVTREGVSEEDVLCVREAKARLEYLERVVERSVEGDGSH